MDQDEMAKITAIVLSMNQKYGCQIIVNGVSFTLKYYLRLIKDCDQFIHEYVNLIKSDKEISFEVKREWNNIVENE